MKHSMKKLQLNKETIAQLTKLEANFILGGELTDTLAGTAAQGSGNCFSAYADYCLKYFTKIDCAMAMPVAIPIIAG